jgi:transcriptional regulator with XRE-family HTH domain
MEQPITISISKKLRKLRLEFRYSQGEVANLLGISQPAYNKIESGTTSISIEYLIKLIKFYKVEIHYFIETEKLSNTLEATVFKRQ